MSPGLKGQYENSSDDAFEYRNECVMQCPRVCNFMLTLDPYRMAFLGSEGRIMGS